MSSSNGSSSNGSSSNNYSSNGSSSNRHNTRTRSEVQNIMNGTIPKTTRPLSDTDKANLEKLGFGYGAGRRSKKRRNRNKIKSKKHRKHYKKTRRR